MARCIVLLTIVCLLRGPRAWSPRRLALRRRSLLSAKQGRGGGSSAPDIPTPLQTLSIDPAYARARLAAMPTPNAATRVPGRSLLLQGDKNSTAAEINARAYERTPFAAMPTSNLYRVLANLVRACDDTRHGVDATGAYADTWERNDGSIVACEVSRLLWVPSSATWLFDVRGVDTAASGELHLGVLTTSEFIILRFDGKTGLRKSGVTKIIWVGAGKGVAECDAAAKRILVKLTTGGGECEVLDRMPLSDERVQRAIDEHGACTATSRRTQQRGANAAEYDWARRDGTTVECKSAQLSWVCSQKGYWKVQFFAIKFAFVGARLNDAFDELLLAIYTPRGIYVYRHDGELGKATNGASSAATGHVAAICGPSGEADWGVALDAILAKFNHNCTCIAHVSLDDPRVDAALAAHPREEMAAAYENVLLAELSSKTRGEVLAALVRGIDDERSGGAVTDAGDGQCSDGTRRGANQRAYDWKRGDTRIECKGAQLGWNKSDRRWEFQLKNIKFGQGVFDELLLALFTPRGVYVYRHDGKLGVSTNGRSSSPTGGKVAFCGPRGGDLGHALAKIHSDLDDGGCEFIELVSLCDARIGTALALHPRAEMADTYRGVRLADLSASTRGKVIETLVCALDTARCG
jgi:hypothetical protein